MKGTRGLPIGFDRSPPETRRPTGGNSLGSSLRSGGAQLGAGGAEAAPVLLPGLDRWRASCAHRTRAEAMDGGMADPDAPDLSVGTAREQALGGRQRVPSYFEGAGIDVDGHDLA